MLRFLRKGYEIAASCSSSPECDDSVDVRSNGGRASKGVDRSKDLNCNYRARLKQEVLKLQKQLQEEIDLHIILENAVGSTTHQSMISSDPPHKATELLSSVASLEIAISKLEDELVCLQLKLDKEKNERHIAEHHFMHPQRLSYSPSCSSRYSWDEQISSLTVLKHHQRSHSLQSTLCSRSWSITNSIEKPDDVYDEMSFVGVGREISESQIIKKAFEFSEFDLVGNCKNNYLTCDLHQHPNKLSEEMVQCMRNIFLILSKSSSLSSSSSPSIDFASPSLSIRDLARSSSNSYSNSSIITMLSQNPCISSVHDPYKVRGKMNQANIGNYSSAAEVTRMIVGKKHLEYVSEALKLFRFLVQKLQKVYPANMNCKEKLAFWINLYNALIMHAYLAYGVPKSEVKLLALMRKASYNVGGHSFNALDIEYILLKRKSPAHCPQMALMLALHHQGKLSDEAKKFAVDETDPHVVFALSWGMYSSPAVRIYTATNIKEELQNSMRDYIQASVGLNNKSRVLVPKLLYCFAKGMVEESFLVDWICRFLTPEQASLVRGSGQQRKQWLLGGRSFTVVAFDPRFRFLFLPQ